VSNANVHSLSVGTCDIEAAPTPMAVHENVAGVGSGFPAWSVAKTENVCGPLATVSVRGDVQLTNGPLSSEHWNVEFGSVDENVKTGFA